MVIRVCNNCGEKEVGSGKSNLERHHIFPKSIGGKDEDGTILLCKSCHYLAHIKLPKILWLYIPEKNKEIAKKQIIKFFECWRRFRHINNRGV